MDGLLELTEALTQLPPKAQKRLKTSPLAKATVEECGASKVLTKVEATASDSTARVQNHYFSLFTTTDRALQIIVTWKLIPSDAFPDLVVRALTPCCLAPPAERVIPFQHGHRCSICFQTFFTRSFQRKSYGKTFEDLAIPAFLLEELDFEPLTEILAERLLSQLIQELVDVSRMIQAEEKAHARTTRTHGPVNHRKHVRSLSKQS